MLDEDRTDERTSDRNRKIVEAYDAGARLADLAARNGISKGRLRQIIRVNREKAERARKMAQQPRPPLPDDLPIENMMLSCRSFHCLRHEGYRTVGDIKNVTDERLLRIRNFGLLSLREVRDLVPYSGREENLGQMRKSPSIRHARGITKEILRERYRQITVEGGSTDRDDGFTDRSLASVAAAYALHASRTDDDRQLYYCFAPRDWPSTWRPELWKPRDRRGDLVLAAALIVAEIERLDRMEAKADT